MASVLVRQVRSLKYLEAAWRNVRKNGIASKAEAVRTEIHKFDEDPSRNLRSLKSRLGHGSFKFPPARGVPIPKPGKKDIRPIVLADVETRIVQRAILDVLQGVKALQPYFRNPYSYGGIKRQQDDAMAAVPAAINAVLNAIDGGARFVVCVDISAFFTCFSKSSVTTIVGKAVNDPEFIEFFSSRLLKKLIFDRVFFVT